MKLIFLSLLLYVNAKLSDLELQNVKIVSRTNPQGYSDYVKEVCELGVSSESTFSSLFNDVETKADMDSFVVNNCNELLGYCTERRSLMMKSLETQHNARMLSTTAAPSPAGGRRVGELCGTETFFMGSPVEHGACATGLTCRKGEGMDCYLGCKYFCVVTPTKIPTNQPTKEPTLAPTKYPTRFPSKSPTKEPTAYPTDSPTQRPTMSPTSDFFKDVYGVIENLGGKEYDNFGWHMSIRDDWLMVGMNGVTPVSGIMRDGYVKIYNKMSDNTWVEQHTVTTFNTLTAESAMDFGVFGTPIDGRVYSIDYTAGTWKVNVVTNTDIDGFGKAVSRNERWLAVGGTNDLLMYFMDGSWGYSQSIMIDGKCVKVQMMSDTMYVLTEKSYLTYSVDIDSKWNLLNNVTVVGASDFSIYGDSVYFGYESAMKVTRYDMVAEDETWSFESTTESFGHHVSVWGDYLVVSAPGVQLVYVFADDKYMRTYHGTNGVVGSNTVMVANAFFSTSTSYQVGQVEYFTNVPPTPAPTFAPVERDSSNGFIQLLDQSEIDNCALNCDTGCQQVGNMGCFPNLCQNVQNCAEAPQCHFNDLSQMCETEPHAYFGLAQRTTLTLDIGIDCSAMDKLDCLTNVGICQYSEFSQSCEENVYCSNYYNDMDGCVADMKCVVTMDGKCIMGENLLKTDAPTQKPTKDPTKKPTTSQPTTKKPTSFPTSSPTDMPTLKPTMRPTAYPTFSLFGPGVEFVQTSMFVCGPLTSMSECESYGENLCSWYGAHCSANLCHEINNAVGCNNERKGCYWTRDGRCKTKIEALFEYVNLDGGVSNSTVPDEICRTLSNEQACWNTEGFCTFDNGKCVVDKCSRYSASQSECSSVTGCGWDERRKCRSLSWDYVKSNQMSSLTAEMVDSCREPSFAGCYISNTTCQLNVIGTHRDVFCLPNVCFEMSKDNCHTQCQWNSNRMMCETEPYYIQSLIQQTKSDKSSPLYSKVNAIEVVNCGGLATSIDCSSHETSVGVCAWNLDTETCVDDQCAVHDNGKSCEGDSSRRCHWGANRCYYGYKKSGVSYDTLIVMDIVGMVDVLMLFFFIMILI